MAGLALLSVLLAQEIVDGLHRAPQIETSIAFDGHVSSAHFTELTVSAIDQVGGDLQLQSTGSAPQLRFAIPLQAGERASVSIPLSIDLSQAKAEIEARLDDSVPQTLPLRYVGHSTPPSLLVGPLATQLLAQLPGTEAVSSSTMPRFAPTYRHVTAVAIDGRTTATLDDAQLRSLLEYAGECGRLLLIDVASSVAQIFMNRAACDKRFLRIAASNTDVPVAFKALLEQPVPMLPSGEELGQLIADGANEGFALKTIGYFWLAYLLVLLFLVSLTRTRVAALGFSIISTVLVLLIWPSATRSAYVAWAEVSSTGRIARFAGLERHSAPRRDEYVLPAKSFGALPHAIVAANVELHWQTDTDQSELIWHAEPFQRIDKLTQGSFAVDPLLRTGIVGSNAVVCNAGLSLSSPLFMHWQDNIYAVPPLNPGAKWSTDDQLPLDREATKSPELAMMRDRSRSAPVTLMQSLDLAGDRKNDRAWLLRYQLENSGAPECTG